MKKTVCHLPFFNLAREVERIYDADGMQLGSVLKISRPEPAFFMKKVLNIF